MISDVSFQTIDPSHAVRFAISFDEMQRRTADPSLANNREDRRDGPVVLLYLRMVLYGAQGRFVLLSHSLPTRLSQVCNTKLLHHPIHFVSLGDWWDPSLIDYDEPANMAI